jgi:hypothetical protein
MRNVTMKRIIASVAAATLLACGYRQPAVRLQGEPSSIQSLAGEWEGQYTMNGADRNGIISFSLASGSDSLYGDVLMIAPTGLEMRAVHRAEEHGIHTRTMQALRIDFVHAEPGWVLGTLEPYIAPDCNCPVTTRFRGIVAGDTIRGTFVTRGEQGGAHDGTWMVTRKR